MKESRYFHRDTYAFRLITGAVALMVFFFMCWVYTTGRTAELDERIVAAARLLRGPVQNTVMLWITHMGDARTIVGIGAVLLIIDAVKWRKADYPLAIGAALITLDLYTYLKALFRRPRPDSEFWLVLEHGFSFPSGHTMNGVFCYGMMLYLLRRNCDDPKTEKALTVLISALIILIPVSRVFCGVHYPSDVITGFSIGFTQLMLYSVIIDEILLRLDIRKKQKLSEPL